MANPYPDPDLSSVLTRQYKIADIVWNDGATDPYDTELGTVDLMKLLVEIRNISDKLTQFRWMRSDIEVEVRVNATPFHIGAVIMHHIPRAIQSVTATTLWASKSQTLTQKSQASGMVISASSLNNLTFIIKREAATLVDPIDEAGAYDGCLGTLGFTVLNPLVVAAGGTVNPVNIAVFARFINPQPSGMGYFPLLSVARVRPQSGEVSAEALRKAGGAITGTEASSLFPTSVVTGVFDSLNGMIQSIAPAAQFAMSLGLSKPPNQSTPGPAIIDDFRDLNYAHGVSNATKLALHPDASLGHTTGGLLKKNSIKEFIGKPSYLQTLVISTESPVDTPLMKIPVHPSLSAFRPADDVFTPTPLAYMSQSFTYWRGGLKFLFQFIGSQFVTARFRVTHWPSPSLPPSIEEFAGDAVSAIVDVRGDVEFPFTAPYISPYPYQQTRGYLHANADVGWNALPLNEQNSFITVSLINAMQVPDAAGDARIYLNVYVSAAEDFVFGGFSQPAVRNPISVASPPLAVRPQSLELSYATAFKPLVPAVAAYEAGAVLPEQYTTVEELCMRYELLDSASQVTGLVSQYQRDGLTIISTGDALEYFARCYRWNRGGVRWKFLFNTTELPDSDRYVFATRQLIDNLSGGADFTVVLDNRLRGVLEFEIPWVLNASMNSWWYSIVADYNVNKEPYTFEITNLLGTTLTPDGVWRSCTDDFMFGHQLPMPVLVYTPPVPPSNVSPISKMAKIATDKLDQSLSLPHEVREKLKKYLILKDSSAGGH